MNIGTKSLLFGVHQFLWHPITVALAWRKCYGVWPKWNEWIAIAFHDVGYKGKPNMDGVEGTKHPLGGAELSFRLSLTIGNFFAHDAKSRFFAFVKACETRDLSLFHSTHYAQLNKKPVSKLYLPDKMSILYDPKWFYLLRARLSGEVEEYRRNAPGELRTPGQWYDWYRNKIQEKYDAHCFTTRAMELRAHSSGRGTDDRQASAGCSGGPIGAGRDVAGNPRTVSTDHGR